MGVMSLLAMLGCASSTSSRQTLAPQGEYSSLRDPYTRTLSVLVSDAVIGYVVRYDEVPLHSDVERALPAGTYRILNLDLEEVGIVTPGGDFRRHTLPGYSESIGHFRLEEGLKRFFGTSGRVSFRPL